MDIGVLAIQLQIVKTNSSESFRSKSPPPENETKKTGVGVVIRECTATIPQLTRALGWLKLQIGMFKPC